MDGVEKEASSYVGVVARGYDCGGVPGGQNRRIQQYAFRQS